MSNRKEYQKEYNKKYYEKHKKDLLPKIRKRVDIWVKENMQYLCEKQKKKGEMERRVYGKTKNSEYSKISRDRIKKEAILAMGGRCKCCNSDIEEFLCIDHIQGGGTKHVKENNIRGGSAMWRYVRDNGYPDDFQLLCHNCNFSKYLGKGICIHKRKVI